MRDTSLLIFKLVFKHGWGLYIYRVKHRSDCCRCQGLVIDCMYVLSKAIPSSLPQTLVGPTTSRHWQWSCCLLGMSNPHPRTFMPHAPSHGPSMPFATYILKNFILIIEIVLIRTDRFQHNIIGWENGNWWANGHYHRHVTSF